MKLGYIFRWVLWQQTGCRRASNTQFHTCMDGANSLCCDAGFVDEENRLEAIDPLCNVVAHRLKHALAYYASPSTPRKTSPEGSRE